MSAAVLDPANASIAELQEALRSGAVTSVALTVAALERIGRYDHHGLHLNSVPVLDPSALAQAVASDRRRAEGRVLSGIDGIPYTAKESYAVAGLTVAAGSPAFRELRAGRDAFAIERLRGAGAVLLGLTTMPPMANGGMQRGLRGRAESPYCADWLTSAFASGSSNGSGTATAAGFGAFGMAEETWSSGRAPAACNALCAYTPSRGVISVRGNWPLVPTMDVVVPHARSMPDLLQLLDVLVADDPETRGDFWRAQPWVPIAAASEQRPASYAALAEGASLAGRRLGVPRMYINADGEAGTNPEGGVGGPTGQAIETRESVIVLWESATAALREAGAEIVEVDFPLVSQYEADRPGATRIEDHVGAEFLHREINDLPAFALDDYLAANGDPALDTLAGVDGRLIFPHPTGSLPDRTEDFPDDLGDYPGLVAEQGCAALEEIPSIAEGVRALEEFRRTQLEDWMDELGLDAVVFPALADVGPADMDVDVASADLGWRNGVWVANGNLAIRHAGVPTVTVPMGVMADIGMPAGLTIAGRGGDDAVLLGLGAAVEALVSGRPRPPRTPEIAHDLLPPDLGEGGVPLSLEVASRVIRPGVLELSISGTAPTGRLRLSVDGEAVGVERRGEDFRALHQVAVETHEHSEWEPPHPHLVIAFSRGREAKVLQVR